jgi:hypothetical protein
MDPSDDSDTTDSAELVLWVLNVVPFKIAVWNNSMFMGQDRFKEYRAAKETVWKKSVRAGKEAQSRKRPRAIESLITYEDEGYRLERAEDGSIRGRRVIMFKLDF